MKALGKSLLWTLPYLVAGFSAPLIFKVAPTHQIGGRFAGTLFLLAGCWSLYLGFRHRYPNWVKTFFGSVFLLELIFWSWRFFNDIPMKNAVLFGLSGSLWHAGLTSLFLVVATSIFIFELKRSDR